MSSWRMMLTELQRLTSGRLPRIALIALAFVPTLYGGLYLYANHDPYGRLAQVPAALVVLDAGATGPDGKPLTAGSDVADQLVHDSSFDWHRVGAAEARDGVRDGTYDFALTIPRDFSSALTSSARFAPEQARLTMTTNDANSYLSTTIADTVTAKVRAAITQRVGSEAATQFLLGFGQIRGSLEQAADGADQLRAGIAQADAGARRLDSGAAELSTGAGQLATGLGTLQQSTAALPAQTEKLAAGARQVADGNAKVARVGDDVAAFAVDARTAYRQNRSAFIARMEALGLTPAQQADLLAVYDRMAAPIDDAVGAAQDASGQLDALSAGATQVADGTRTLADGMPKLAAAVTTAHTGATKLATGATQLHTGATALAGGLDRLRAGSATLATKLRGGLDDIPDVGDADRTRIADTIADPVAVSDVAQTRAGSYGAGLAPFFMSLAAWIGGYVLFLVVRPLSRRAMAANQTPARVALGGWLTPALIGVVQMALLLLVTAAAIRIVPANVTATFAFLLLMSATFVAIVHALNAWLGVAGQFLGLVLMVLQLVSAGGTFPWQTIPAPLYVLHHLLPMGYAVDGLRQLMYGGLTSLVARDVGVLLVWFAIGLLASSLAARRQRIWTVSRVKPELVT